MNPINARHLKRATAIHNEFLSGTPLPRFTVLPDFAPRQLVADALAGCKRAHFETFCGYSMTPDGAGMQSEFREPDESAYYVTIHKRSRVPVPEVVRLREAFETPEAIAALNAMTGAGIARMYHPDVLTCWDPGCFLEVHTDEAPHIRFRLVVVLSLTDGWNPAFGGTTCYAWKDLDRCVRIPPHLNAAVLFTPFEGSNHWVEQISTDAPRGTRFTWTAFYS